MTEKPETLAYRMMNWALMLLCSVIWGFSYFFIKHALMGFDPIQVVCLRSVSAAIALIPLVYLAAKRIPRNKYPHVLLCAVAGNGIPMYLYPLAQTHISSSVTGIINSLTPLCTYFIGISFFGMRNVGLRLAGVLTGLLGAASLILFRSAATFNADFFYLCAALCAPVLYGLNANILKTHLSSVPALPLTAMMYFVLLLPALPMLFFSGIPEKISADPLAQQALPYALMLGLFGTAVAMSLFNILVRRADIMFAASISYLMPLVAVVLGLLDHETLAMNEIMGLALILGGVLLTNLRVVRPVTAPIEAKEQ
jgi:drug/metabolite transporter (DMT)-like permease